MNALVPYLSRSGLVLCLFAAHAMSQTNLVTFDDGPQGAAVGTFYTNSGVVMSNAVWSANVDARGLPFQGASGQFVLFSQTAASSPTRDNPIVAVFAKPMKFAGITACDVGTAGARLEAYDAEIGGNLVASKQAFGSGVGFDSYGELGVYGGPIRRIHFFQPAPNGSDGVVWDNLRFAEVDPAAVDLQLYAGVWIQGTTGCRYQVQYTTNLLTSNWTALADVLLATSPQLWLDTNSPVRANRYYRSVLR